MWRSQLQTWPQTGTSPQERAPVNIYHGIDCFWRSCRLLQSERAKRVTLAEGPPREDLLPPSTQAQSPCLWTKPTLPRMEQAVLRMVLVFVLGTHRWPCTGKRLHNKAPALNPCRRPRSEPGLTAPRVLVCPAFPVYDYDPSSLREAVSASVAKVNAQALSPYLFRAFRSSLRRVSRHPPLRHEPAPPSGSLSLLFVCWVHFFICFSSVNR